MVTPSRAIHLASVNVGVLKSPISIKIPCETPLHNFFQVIIAQLF